MHISELAEGGVGAVTDVLKEGQEIQVTLGLRVRDRGWGWGRGWGRVEE